MPDDDFYSQLGNSAASAINNVGSYVAAGNFGRKSYKYNKMLYEQQQADNFANWMIQNHYNSPKEQMKRLEAAGLNKNMALGGSGFSGQASNIDSGSFPAPQMSMPDFKAGAPLESWYDTRFKNAQLDNVEAQKAVLMNQGLLTYAQTLKTLSETDEKKLDVLLKEKGFDTSLQAQQANLDRVLNEISVMSNRDIRESEMHKGNLKKQDVDIAHTEEDTKRITEVINLLKKQGIISDYDIRNLKAGISQNAPWFVKFFTSIAKRLMGQ